MEQLLNWIPPPPSAFLVLLSCWWTFWYNLINQKTKNRGHWATPVLLHEHSSMNSVTVFNKALSSSLVLFFPISLNRLQGGQICQPKSVIVLVLRVQLHLYINGQMMIKMLFLILLWDLSKWKFYPHTFDLDLSGVYTEWSCN